MGIIAFTFYFLIKPFFYEDIAVATQLYSWKDRKISLEIKTQIIGDFSNITRCVYPAC
jgi:hypothetical protein